MKPLQIPDRLASSEVLSLAYARGFNHGHGIACHNVPTLGAKVLSDSLGRVTVDAENIREVHESACHEAESSSRDFSPFEFLAHELNELGDGEESGTSSEDAWAAFDEGISDAIGADLATYDDEAYGIPVLPLRDSQSLVGAKNQFGHSIPVYDDGFGACYIHRDSMGISGIVRAQTWEDAYEICEDEFFPEASDTVAEMVAEYGEDFTENACWQEAYGFRPNGPRSGKWANGSPRDPLGHGIFAKDLNGDALNALSVELLKDLQITLEVSS